VQTISHKRWLGFPANCSQLLRVGSGIAIAIITTQTKFADIFHAKYSFLVFINFVNAAVVRPPQSREALPPAEHG
jgi:hypothetical protein